MASIIQRRKMKQNCFLWPMSPPRTPALHRGFGAVGTFRSLRSGPDQARHLPEAPVPRPRKSIQSHTRGIPPAVSLVIYSTTCYIHTPDVSLRYSGVSFISHF